MLFSLQFCALGVKPAIVLYLELISPRSFFGFFLFYTHGPVNLETYIFCDPQFILQQQYTALYYALSQNALKLSKCGCFRKKVLVTWIIIDYSYESQEINTSHFLCTFELIDCKDPGRRQMKLVTRMR